MVETETKFRKPGEVEGLNFFQKQIGTKKGKQRIISIVAGLAIIGIGYNVGSVLEGTLVRDTSIMAGIITIIIPITITQMKETKRKSSIDSNLPIFLLALISAVTSGASLLRAIEEAADRNMGSLTPELKNLRANISWGMPYDEAFELFSNRVGTKLAKRVGILLQISFDIGGDVTGTLELIQTHVTEMQNLEKDRKAALAPYIFTIYISFVVFLAITLILVANFFSEIEVVQDQLRTVAEERDIELGMFGSILGIRVSELAEIMFTMSLVEAVFGGLAAGKIGESSFMAGIKHVIVMVVMAVMAFAVIG